MSGSVNVDHALLITVVAGLSAMSDISQGSVTTSMRCGGIFCISVITNFVLIPTVKIFFENWLIIHEVIGI